jgi:uracil phosphoribosyltransferase
MTPNCTVIDHPLVKHKLTLMRRASTSTANFRALLSEISVLLAYEATRDLKLKPEAIKTPLADIDDAPMLDGKKLVLIAIMRAGQGIVDGALEIMPSARVGHIGIYRDPQTLKAVEYYFKVPGSLQDRDVLVCDPMLATGNSAIAAVDRIKATNPASLRFVCLLACPEGLANFHGHHPDVPVVTASVDERLNEHGYIVPGLGDAGDRLFGTKLRETGAKGAPAPSEDQAPGRQREARGQAQRGFARNGRMHGAAVVAHQHDAPGHHEGPRARRDEKALRGAVVVEGAGDQRAQQAHA